MIPLGAGGAVGSAAGRYAYFGVFEGGIFELASGFGWFLEHGGASPRAAVALLLCSKALAAIRGRSFVTPDDVKEIAKPVLRHRIVLRSEAEIEGASPDQVLNEVIAGVEVPR